MQDPYKIYTPRENIPVCAVTRGPENKAVLVFKKPGGQSYEEIPLWEFIAHMTSCVFGIMTDSSDLKLPQIAEQKK